VTAADSPPPVDGSGTARARCVLAPNPGPMTLNGTNTWLIAEPGSTVAMVVDPGPDDEAHLGRVRDLAAAAGQRISRILLTHGHLDHSAGAARLASLTGAPVLAADPALRRSPGERGGPGGSNTGEGLGPGDVLTEAGCELRVVASPGHTADSVCLLLPADGALLTGDTVLGRGTTVIAGDGNLADYLATLDRLRALADEQQLSTLLPGHGPLLADPAGVLDFYISHRQERLAEIRAALAAGDRTGEEIVARVYADVDRSLWPFARWSVRAQLDYLASRGELPPGVSA
jgi:glyoxylase-like metal-dependent hydrolase (beta-lactamase superfamily II)